jgi:hypothetical protein
MPPPHKKQTGKQERIGHGHKVRLRAAEADGEAVKIDRSQVCSKQRWDDRDDDQKRDKERIAPGVSDNFRQPSLLQNGANVF